jgi:hypothetical protein
VIAESAIRLRFEALAPVLDERALRRSAAAEAQAAGHGGVAALNISRHEFLHGEWNYTIAPRTPPL